MEELQMYERGGQQHSNAPSRLVWASTHMQRCDEWTGEKKRQKLLSAKIVHLSVSSGNSSVKESDPHHLIINCEPYTDFIYDPKWFKNYICEPIVLAKKSNCLSKYRLVLKKIFPPEGKTDFFEVKGSTFSQGKDTTKNMSLEAATYREGKNR